MLNANTEVKLKSECFFLLSVSYHCFGVMGQNPLEADGREKVERTAECITSVWIFVDKSGNLEESAETDC